MAAPPDAARLGWPAPDAPAGRALPLDLRAVDEAALLGPGGAARLYPLARAAGDVHRDREPLVLIHGIDASPSYLQAIANRAGDRFQLYALAYDSLHRRVSDDADDLARELGALHARRLAIVAHSMGGIVARVAIGRLAARRALPFERVRLVAIDTPWQGYPGPSDRGAGRVLVAVTRPFLPAALEDMRARSSLFEELRSVPLPPTVEVYRVSAGGGPAPSFAGTHTGVLCSGELLAWVDRVLRAP